MRLEDPSTTPLLFSAGPGSQATAMRLPTASRPFSEVLAQSRQAPATRTVVSGDTLLSIVREQAQQQGLTLSGPQALREALQLARDSGIRNPERIFPGQRLALGGLQVRLLAQAGGMAGTAALPAAQVLARSDQAAPEASRSARRQGASAYGQAAAWAPRPASTPGPPAHTPASTTPATPPTTSTRTASHPLATTPATPASLPGHARALQRPPALAASEPVGPRHFLAGPHRVLEQTLDRAVARGFIPAIERGDVYHKILELAARHQFRPDDFARMTLMESDGLNPRASNERCHGIIQFCDGSDRGAATAGFAANPRAILGFSVYQQLHLVDRYFSEVGVKPQGGGPASLDDLYLAVLMPAARSNTQREAPLNIPGPQARVLHVGRDRSAPITRQSILEGLQHNAMDRLSAFAQRMRPQAVRDDTLPAALGGTRIR